MIADAKVNTTSNAYDRMEPHWNLVDDLLGGTLAMRKAGTTWLPKEYMETDQEYNVRLQRTILSNYYEDTLKKVGGKPFARQIKVDNCPDQLLPLIDDVDGTGKSLTQYGREALTMGINHGFVGLFVDYPSLDPGITLKEEKEAGARPFLNIYKAPQIISFRVEGTDLWQIVFQESTVEYPDAEFGEETVVKYRVVRKNEWELWRPKDKNSDLYVIEASGQNTFGSIPLAVFYTNREAFMEATPALEDLAYANLEHWQRKSDYSNLLHYTGMATLFFNGVDEEFSKAYQAVGTNKMMVTSNSEADGKYLEISGNGADALRKELIDIQERMMIHALQPLVSRSGNITATEKAIEEGNNQSDIQSWIRGLESALEQTFELAAKWMNVELPEDFKIDIFNEFGLTLRAQKDIESLLKARIAKEITREVFLKEMKRRTLIAEDEDIMAMITQLDAEQEKSLKDMMDATFTTETESE